ncbi:brain-enriched guanylate kinase-associated protein [Anguilla anguilla]|uniref:brain-enriched guanylate kinase-associated protein n=1 Tax=Anguilla anguilla TaxID=7936 RepID=UPI0015AE1818|nr:brain-enriched guanylate kinase-associated protein [Anguilla anguilla]
MVQLTVGTIADRTPPPSPKMPNGSARAGSAVTANGTSTLPRQLQPKTANSRQERGSCSSTSSCPVCSEGQSDPEEEPLPCYPSSLSSPSLQSSLPNLQSSVPSLRSSSSTLRSSSPSPHSASSSEDDSSWDTNSWSSGATCLLRSSIKKHSEEVFQARLGSGSRGEIVTGSEGSHLNGDGIEGSCTRPECQEGAEWALGRRDSLQSLSSSQGIDAASGNLDQKIEDKLKFSQFLDEVTCRVLAPGSLEAFGILRQKDPASFWEESPSTYIREPRRSSVVDSVYQWTKTLPSCKILDANDIMRNSLEERGSQESPGRAYLETDIDSVRLEDELESNSFRETRKESLKERERGMERRAKRITPERTRSPTPLLNWSKDLPKYSYRSTSLPRSMNSLACDGEMHNISSLQEQKDDLRKRLSYTTHKLELLETEFDSTRQYLETELRRAQEELEKFTDKLRRIQNSYAALQRINQDLEDKIHRASQHHDEEKRALSREIIVLNNHLMEAKITIEKLREDNDLYRKDCNLAAQLLQCSKSHYRAHKLSELPSDFKERLSMHMEKHSCGVTMALCHSPYPDSVPTSVIAKVLEKPESGTSCPASRSPSPHPQDPEFLANSMGSSEGLHRRAAYKSSDLYSSDTALYCPEERQRERRQSADLQGPETGVLQPQNSTDSNPEEDGFHPGFAHLEPSFAEFAVGSLPASSSYSSFSMASDEKGHALSSTISSSQQALYMDWRDGEYERKSTSSYEKDSPSFPKSRSFQQVAQGPQNGSAPAYVRTASCFSEPYHSPRLTSSHSVGSAQPYDGGRGSVHIPEEELSGRWRQLSVEDINAYSYRNLGRVSPYSFSEQHFAVGPSKIKLGPLYSSFQEGDDVYHSAILDQCFAASPSPSPEHSLGLCKQDKGPLYRAKEDSQESERSLFHSGSSKDKESTAGSMKKEYVDVSPNSSAESLNQSPLEPCDMQHYQLERQSPTHQRKMPTQYQKSGNTGLCRKDSLTKAQLYGTLLN